ncbi:MgtC/SapB family protein [Sphingomicrobium lutaoense]|uniref:Protein MgtC n=1 Tax=Sphingomicrobium lutaoense TaxID=515949 RepID=A0A839YZB7_9SPHN|nr:MgtC/SapB family protein [Sphingomicrobium lutaoense]MBB3763668.1 putative Mg2+ transporter-C (MgtC) family protein [Sphingomicrobium lutaoense]
MELNPAIAIDGLDADLLLRVGLAALIGLLLGFDRELRGHAAGMRTHGIVCVSAAAMTISVMAIYLQLGPARMDPLRLFEAAGAFIGIIGAGLIIFSKGRVHNLTTAAHLWLTAVIGIACGAGQWPLVLIGTVISVVMITLLGIAEKMVRRGHRLEKEPREE